MAVGRKCSICTSKKVGQINKLITQGVSFRPMSSQVFGRQNRYRSIIRHATNCLKFDVQKALEEKRIERGIDVYKEFQEQLQYAKELREAGQSEFRDENGKITLIPHMREVDILYDDPNDLTQAGEPKRKRINLDVAQDKMEKTGLYSNTFAMVNTPDRLKMVTETLKATDVAIDKLAKIEGTYTKEKENPESLSDNDLAEELARRLTEKGWKPKQITAGVKAQFPDVNVQELKGIN